MPDEIKKEAGTEESNGVAVVKENGKEISIDLEGTILNVVDTDIKAVFIEPKPSQTTMIATLMARCVVPTQMDVFSIPEKLMNRIIAETKDSEAMLPPDIIRLKREINNFKMETGSLALNMLKDDPVDMYIFEAIQGAGNMVRTFKGLISNFCADMSKIQGQYASEKSFYMQQTLGSQSLKVPTPVILAAIQNTIVDLNRMSSGEGGYKILALLKSIDKVGKFLTNDTIMKLYSANSTMSMLNKLEYRVMPDMVMFNDNLSSLMELIQDIGEKKSVEKEQIIQLITISQEINDYLTK